MHRSSALPLAPTAQRRLQDQGQGVQICLYQEIVTKVKLQTTRPATWMKRQAIVNDGGNRQPRRRMYQIDGTRPGTVVRVTAAHVDYTSAERQILE